ncbi:MAG TPA: hypothetical protein DCO77_04230 [Nitrospiraceae bacterium]|nr:hypothetical protein [Nitrospiraceae bacterium]
MNSRHLYIGIFAVLFLVTGCAKKGPVLVTVATVAPEKKEAPAKKIVVGLSALKDIRDQKSSVLGTTTIPSGTAYDLVTQGTVADLVTTALKGALEARGVTVKDIPDWDLSAEGITAEGVDIVIGGQIKKLLAESKSEPFQTKITATVQLKFVVADGAEKTIIQTLTLNNRNTSEGVLFSAKKVGSTLGGALSSAIDQLLNDEKVSERFQ